jgi:hypothetical protein
MEEIISEVTNKKTRRMLRVTLRVTVPLIVQGFRTGSVEREPQMIELSATRYSCIAIL